MYYWKCWRDNRVGFFGYLIMFFALTGLWMYAIHRANRVGHVIGTPEETWVFILGVTFALALLGASVVALGIGSNNAGTDIGSGSGDFLFTRPRSRSYFIWAGWTAGMVQIAFLTTFTVLASTICIYYQTDIDWRRLSGGAHQGMAAFGDVFVLIMTVMVTASIIYGLTYFMGILTRSGRKAAIFSLGLIVAYGVSQALLSWLADISIPDLTIKPYFLGGFHYVTGPVSLQWKLQLGARALVALAFPVAAQIALGRSDI
jgi:hypothetical protein